MRELVDLTLLKYISIASSSSSTNSSLCPPHSHLLGYLCGAGRFTAMSGSLLLPQSQQEAPTPPPPMDTAAQDSAASLRAAALLTLKSKKKRKLDNSDSQQQSLPRPRVTASSTIQLDYGSEAPSSSAPRDASDQPLQGPTSHRPSTPSPSPTPMPAFYNPSVGAAALASADNTLAAIRRGSDPIFAAPPRPGVRRRSMPISDFTGSLEIVMYDPTLPVSFPTIC